MEYGIMHVQIPNMQSVMLGWEREREPPVWVCLLTYPHPIDVLTRGGRAAVGTSLAVRSSSDFVHLRSQGHGIYAVTGT